MNVLGCLWIYRNKLNADGTFKKHRAIVVARGNEQSEGIDYLETYSPVVRSATVRTVLHIATVMQWSIRQMDVKNAFLHGDLAETVYMCQPAGFVDKSKPDHVCLLLNPCMDSNNRLELGLINSVLISFSLASFVESRILLSSSIQKARM